MSALGWLRAQWSRLAAGLALATVAAVSGAISYGHIDWLTLALGGSRLVGHLMPFGVDGQIVMGSIVLLTITGRRAWWGWLGIVPGLAESLFANWESGISHGLLAAGWYTVPAQAFAVASFLFERWLKSQVAGVASAAGTSVVANGDDSEADRPNPCPHYIAGSAEEAMTQAFLHSRDCLGTPLSQRVLSTSFGVSRPKVAELVAPHVAAAPEPSMNGSAAGA